MLLGNDPHSGILHSPAYKKCKRFCIGGPASGSHCYCIFRAGFRGISLANFRASGAALVAGMLEIWTVVGSVGVIIFSWLIVAYPMRQATEKYNALTLPEYFEKKFNDNSGIIRLFSSFIITFFFTFYVAAQFSGAGKVLHVTFGMTQMQGMILGAVIIIFYTLMGGVPGSSLDRPDSGNNYDWNPGDTASGRLD